MKKLIYSSFLLLNTICIYAQKPDLIRSPNGPNTIIDWNVKFKTLIIPHGNTLTLAGGQDSTGAIRLLVNPGVDTVFSYYVRGYGWVKVANRRDVMSTSGVTQAYLIANYYSKTKIDSLINSTGDIAYNGLTKSNDTLSLGGILSKAIRINNTNATLTISSDNAYYGALQSTFYPDGFTFNIGQSQDQTYGSSSFSMYNYGGGFRVGPYGIFLNSTNSGGFLIGNSTHIDGVKYSDKQNFTSPRSIPDIDWVTHAIDSLTSGKNGVISVSGTTNRITSTGGTTPVIDISSTFEGTLGKVANPLSQFAPTTSAQLLGVISDETGGGSAVFSQSPAFTGVPTVPTAAGGTNTSQAASTAFVSNGLSNKQNLITLTTNNSSGVATFNQSTGALNIPNYAVSGGSTPTGNAGGDLTGTYPNPALATVNLNPGTYGTASSVPIITVNGKGLAPTVTSTAIQIAESQVTNLVSDLSASSTAISNEATKARAAESGLSNRIVSDSTRANNIYTGLGLKQSKILAAYAVGANTAVAAGDSVELAIEKLQGQVNAKQNTITNGYAINFSVGILSADTTLLKSKTSAGVDYTNLSNRINGKEPVQSGTGYLKKSGSTTSYISAISNGDLANNTISGIPLGSTLAALTPGYGLLGSAYTGATPLALTLDTANASGPVSKPNLAARGYITASSTNIVTNKDFSSATNTFRTFNQNTTGSAATLTTPRTLAGNSFNGSANVPFANNFIVQGTADAGLTGAQFLGALGTGLLKNTTSTGVLLIAVSGTDYAPPTTGNSLLKANGSGGFTNAISGTDYQPAGSYAIDPTTTAYDLPYRNGSNVLSRLPIGSNNTYLGVNGSGVLGYLSGTINFNSLFTGAGTSGSPIGINKSTTSVDGYLAAADFAVFNAKQSALTFNGTGNTVNTTSPSLVTPNLGVATATSLNKYTLTAPSIGATIALANASTLQITGGYTLNNTLTANSTPTYPAGAGTLAYLAGNNTWTGINTSQSTFNSSFSSINSLTASSGSAATNLFSATPTLNLTGTYNGTVRGFYYSPSITAMTGKNVAFEATSGDFILGTANTYSTGGFNNIVRNTASGRFEIVANSGTTNYIPKYTATGAQINSRILDDGTNVSIAGGSLGINTSTYTGGATNELNLKAASGAGGIGAQSNDGTSSIYLRSGVGSDGSLIGFQNNLSFGITTGPGTSGFTQIAQISATGITTTGTVTATNIPIPGKITLSAGVGTATISGVSTTSTATTGFVSIGGTVSTTWQYKVACTANTVTITAITNTGTTDTADTSTISYSVIK